MRIELRERRPGDIRRWLACVGALLLIAAGLAWLHRSGTPACLFHRLTGWPCLTCGSTRAFAALAAGNLSGALLLQPLAVIGGAMAGVGFLSFSVLLVGLRRAVRVRLVLGEALLLCGAGVVLAALNWLHLMRCGV